MSGGSYDYLHATELVNARGHLESMRDRLHELGHHDAALRTAQGLAAYQQIDGIQAELYGVWKAVEWIDSGDRLAGDEEEDVAKGRQSGKISPPERADMVKRLYELEREARALRLKCNCAYVTESNSPVADAKKRA